MKTHSRINRVLFFVFSLISLAGYAQVSIDKKINMTGATSDDRRITGVGDVTLAADAVSAQVLQKGSLVYVETVGGNANAITAATSPSFIPQAGTVVSFKVASNNTSAVTLDLNGSGASNVYKNNNAPLIANELKVGQVITVVFDGTDWEMVGADNLGNHQATQDITTSGNNDYDIGSSTNPFKNIYLGSDVKIDGATFVSNGGTTSTLLGETQNTTNTAGDNVFIGYQTGKSNTSGYGNVFAGYQAGMNTTTTGYSVFIGYQTGYNNTSGYANIFQGYQSGYNNTSGSYNHFLGIYSGNNNTTGSYNTAIGYLSGYNNSIGNDNIFIGYSSGYNNTTSGSIFIGSMAGYSNTTGDGNVSIGNQSTFNNTSGNRNTSLGSFSRYFGSIGNDNTTIGYSAGYTLATNSGNTVLGSMAGYYLSSGDNNTLVGNYAGFSVGLISYSSSTALGRSSFIGNGVSNGSAIGYASSVTTSNTMSFGNASVTCWVFGRTSSVAGTAICVGTNASNGNGAYLTQGGVWTNTSDKNKKENFKSLNGKDIISKINQLKITRWNYIGEDPSIQHIGPMAQDFYRLFQLGHDDKSISTIDPAGVALIAIQELDKKDKELESKQKELELKTQEIDQLKAELEFNRAQTEALAQEIRNIKTMIQSNDKQAMK